MNYPDKRQVITPEMELEIFERLGIDNYIKLVFVKFFPLPFRIRFMRYENIK